LKTFDPNISQHTGCRLSFGVHATDFDDEYSREYIEWLHVNGMQVMQHCDPMAKGCGKGAVENRTLHPCVTDYSLDDLFRSGTTTLQLASKISEMVDECPVDNNLLSGRVSVTCWLKPWPVTTSPTAKPAFPELQECSSSLTTLRCQSHGCTANTTASACSWLGGLKEPKCSLTVKIWQTDFDDKATESVEWVKVDGVEIAKDLKPGRNPCKAYLESTKKLASGLLAKDTDVNNSSVISLVHQSPTRSMPSEDRKGSLLDESRKIAVYVPRDPRGPSDEMYEIVKEQDVTKGILANGSVAVEAKISNMVDECGKDGYLLSAEVTVVCKSS
jgi:hypothetical protein